MNIQGRIGKTAASKLGISLFDCTGNTIRQLRELVRAETLRAHAADGPQPSARDAPENRTMALEDSEIQVITEPRGLPADNRTMELSGEDILTDPQSDAGKARPAHHDDENEGVEALLADIGRLTGRPPPAAQPKFTAARHDDSVLFDMGSRSEEGSSGDSSVIASLAELQRLGSERPPQASEPKPPQAHETKPPRRKEPESSVEMSLQELQDIESARLEEEAAARAEAERLRAGEEARLRAQRESEEAQKRAAEAERNAAEEAAMRAAEEELAREVDELLESTAPGEGGEERAYQLSEIEMLMLSDVLPEGRTMWIVPLAPARTLEEDERLAALIGQSPTITVAERTYYICSESFGAPKALMAERKGVELVLKRPKKEESAEMPLEAGEPAAGLDWSHDHISYTLKGEEMTTASIVMPERALRWLLPAPDAGTDEATAKAILRRFKEEPRIALEGRTYFVFAGKDGFAGARWCARTGCVLQIWADASTDYEFETSMGGSASVRVMDVAEPGKGIPWEKGHVRYMLNGDEYIAAFQVLPEKAVRWLIPAPEGDMKDRVSESIRGKFRDEPRLQLGGKTYYVYDGEEGFANARWCARTGNILNVWPQQMTEYDYAGSVGGGPSEASLRTVEEADWPEKFFYHRIGPAEEAACAELFPEGKPVLMHPAPREESGLGTELTMLEEMRRLGARKAHLGGNDYFVVSIEDVPGWRQMTIYCPKARLAARNGDAITVWEDAGRGLFSGTTFNIYPSDEKGAPLPLKGGHVAPYENELLDLECLYEGGKRSRYLYRVPDRPGDMDIITFNNLVQIASGEAAKTGQSPLVSIRGRWYFALEYAYVGARLTTLEGKVLHVYQENTFATSQEDALARMRERLVQKRRESEPEFVTLPNDPAQRARLLASFPPQKVRYLYNVDPSDPNYRPLETDLIVRDGDFESVWRMTDHPIPGMTIPVTRRGDKIYPVAEERAPSRAPPPPPHKPTMQGLPAMPARRSSIPPVPASDLLEAVRKAAEDMEQGEQLKSDEIEIMGPESPPPPPRRPTMHGLAPPSQRQPEASDPAMQIRTGEFELITEGPEAKAPPPARTPKPPEKAAKGEASEPGTEIRTGEFEIIDDDEGS